MVAVLWIEDGHAAFELVPHEGEEETIPEVGREQQENSTSRHVDEHSQAHAHAKPSVHQEEACRGEDLHVVVQEGDEDEQGPNGLPIEDRVSEKLQDNSGKPEEEIPCLCPKEIQLMKEWSR